MCVVLGLGSGLFGAPFMSFGQELAKLFVTFVAGGPLLMAGPHIAKP